MPRAEERELSQQKELERIQQTKVGHWFSQVPPQQHVNITQLAWLGCQHQFFLDWLNLPCYEVLIDQQSSTGVIPHFVFAGGGRPKMCTLFSYFQCPHELPDGSGRFTCFFLALWNALYINCIDTFGRS